MIKKSIFIILITLIILGCQQNTFDISQYETTTTQINQTEIQLAIADTLEFQAQGFMNVTKIPENEGMLFVYESPAPRSFWMKNTLLPLDIIFLNQNKEIINIHHNTPPCKEIDPEQTSCPSYLSSGPSQFIIELPSPQAEKLNLQENQKINLELEQ